MSREKVIRNKRWARLLDKGYSVRHVAQMNVDENKKPHPLHFTTIHGAAAPYRKNRAIIKPLSDMEPLQNQSD